MIQDNIMSQIDLPADFDFQRAGREVLDIEREGLAQLDQYINEDFTRYLLTDKDFRLSSD